MGCAEEMETLHVLSLHHNPFHTTRHHTHHRHTGFSMTPHCNAGVPSHSGLPSHLSFEPPAALPLSVQLSQPRDSFETDGSLRGVAP